MSDNSTVTKHSAALTARINTENKTPVNTTSLKDGQSIKAVSPTFTLDGLDQFREKYETVLMTGKEDEPKKKPWVVSTIAIIVYVGIVVTIAVMVILVWYYWRQRQQTIDAVRQDIVAEINEAPVVDLRNA